MDCGTPGLTFERIGQLPNKNINFWWTLRARGGWWLLVALKMLGAFTNWANSVDLRQRPFAEMHRGAVGTKFERIGGSPNEKVNFWWTLRARSI
jgi:hypothetical protein